MSAPVATGLARPLSPQVPPLSRMAFAVARTVMAWETRRIERHALRRLDDHMLRDIGLPVYEARAEAQKPFWRA